MGGRYRDRVAHRLRVVLSPESVPTERRMMGLRVRLFLLVLIAVLPAIAIQIYTEIDLRRSREAEIHEDALRHAGTVAGAMLEILEGSRQLLVALARLPPV